MNCNLKSLLKILAMLMIAVLLPVNSWAATEPLNNGSSIYLKNGGTYSLALKEGQYPILSCVNNMDDLDEIKLKSIKSSDTNIAKVELDSDKKDFFIDAVDKGTTTITVTDVNGVKSVIYLTVGGAEVYNNTKLSFSGIIDVLSGKTYTLTMEAGHDTMIWCFDDFEDDDELFLDSIDCSNSNVALAEIDDEDEDCFSIDALSAGTATITVTDENDVETTIKLTVTGSAGGNTDDEDDEDDDSDYTDPDDEEEIDYDKVVELQYDDVLDIQMGRKYSLTMKAGQDSMIWCYTDSDMDEEASLDDVYSSKTSVASAKLDEDMEECFDIVAKSAGKTTITVEDDEGDEATIKLTVTGNKQPKSSIRTKGFVYKNSKKVKVKATNVLKGDEIRLKIGKKTYKKKITKAASSKTVTIKIKKPGFYGKKYKLTLVRSGKTIASKKAYVYLSNYVHVGDTKKKVKWLTYWNKPDKKSKSAYSEQWCYDWDGDGYYDAYLYFRKGKVSNWQTYS